jgi:hypothetical protein
MLYSIRSERLLMEEMYYNILFRWFVGLNLDEEVWDATTFTKNRERLLEADVAKQFLAEVVEMARQKGVVSDEHFTVDGTLLEAWASAKSAAPFRMISAFVKLISYVPWYVLWHITWEVAGVTWIDSRDLCFQQPNFGRLMLTVT